MGVYNGYNVGRGALYTWTATDEMQNQGYQDVDRVLYNFRDIAIDAFEVWDNGVNFNFIGTSVTEDASIYVGIKIVSRSVGTSARTVFDDPDGDGWLGSNGEGTASIYLDLTYDDRYDRDLFEELLTREVGHVVGLSDRNEAGSIMNPALDGDPSLSVTDSALVQQLYANLPPNTTTTTTTTPTTSGATGSDTISGSSGNDRMVGSDARAFSDHSG